MIRCNGQLCCIYIHQPYPSFNKSISLLFAPLPISVERLSCIVLCLLTVPLCVLDKAYLLCISILLIQTVRHGNTCCIQSLFFSGSHTVLLEKNREVRSVNYILMYRAARHRDVEKNKLHLQSVSLAWWVNK